MTTPETAQINSNEIPALAESNASEDNQTRQQREDFEEEQDLAHQLAVNNEKKRRRRVLTLQLLACFCVSGLSFLLLYADLRRVSVAMIIYENQQTIIAFALLITVLFFFANINANVSRSFQDVDIRQRLGLKKRTLPPAAWPFPTSERFSDLDLDRRKMEELRSIHFYKHFEKITRELEERASNAEEKASILLDKGTTYTIAGIVFFIISIITWQIVSWVKGFQNEFIYGIISCATLFIFIEFLSAWFLRQYRHFIDTATYLLKVKSIFDRFALVYLAGDAIPSELTAAKTESINTLLRMLEEQIKWPDSYILKKPEVGFASEAVQAMTSLAKELRKAQKRARSSVSNKDQEK